MSLQSLLVHAVTRLRAATTTDRYGATAEDWSNVTETALTGWIAQSDAIEAPERNRTASVWRLTLVLPADADVNSRDRFEIDGTVYLVDGQPNLARTPRGAHHLEVALKAVEG